MSERQRACTVRAVQLSWKTLGGWPAGEDSPGDHEIDKVLGMVDLGLVPVFTDERPLTGLAAYVDWRSGGQLTRWIDRGLFRGEAGERLLCPGSPDLALERLVLMGVGASADFGEAAAREFARALHAQSKDLRASQVVVSWPNTQDSAAHEAALDDLLQALRPPDDAEDERPVDEPSDQGPSITSASPEAWWLVAGGPLYTRLRGRVLGTPRAATPR